MSLPCRSCSSLAICALPALVRILQFAGISGFQACWLRQGGACARMRVLRADLPDQAHACCLCKRPGEASVARLH